MGQALAPIISAAGTTFAVTGTLEGLQAVILHTIIVNLALGSVTFTDANGHTWEADGQ